MKGQHDHPIQPTYRNYINLIINVSAYIGTSEYTQQLLKMFRDLSGKVIPCKNIAF